MHARLWTPRRECYCFITRSKRAFCCEDDDEVAENEQKKKKSSSIDAHFNFKRKVEIRRDLK